MIQQKYWVGIFLVSLSIAALLMRLWGVLEEASAQGTTYYVAPGGNDLNTGTTEGDSWQTIQKAANTVQAGDTVYVRGGVYAEAVTINVSGSAGGGYITFQNYPGETPILDGTGLTVPASDTGMFLIVDQNYLIIKGFEIRNYTTAATNRVPVGINIRGASHHIQLRNNRIHHIETNATIIDANAHGIAVYGTAAPASINNIIIDGNELYNLKLGQSEAMALNGNVEVFTVTNNIVHDNDNIGIDFIGFEGKSPNPAYDQTRNGIVISNTIYNIDTLNNPTYVDLSAGGIYVDGGTNILIERNRVYSSNIGIEIASEHQGKATSYTTVRNNFVFNNHMVGIAMGGYDTNRGSTENCVVINNTLYNNDTLKNGNGEIQLNFDTRNNVIKNNIVHANSQSLLIGNTYTQNTGNIVDYNIFYALGGTDGSEWEWKGITYTGFAAYKAGSGNDTNSMFIDPKFVDTANFNLHLQSTSPAIDAGQNLAEVGDYDIDGEARLQGSKIDMGADEVTPNLSLSSVTDPHPVQATTPVITYTITLQNNGGLDATGVTITSTIPSSTTYKSGGDSFVDPNIVWNNLTVTSNWSISVSFQVTITEMITDGNQLINAILASSAEGITASLVPNIVTVGGLRSIYLPAILKNN